jgi:putative membrane protein
MKLMIAAAIAAALAATAPAFAQQPPKDGNAAQAGFVREAIQGDIAEMQLGKLAQDKSGNNKQLADFGKMIENDHSANKVRAEALARELNVAPPGSPNAEQQNTYEQLSQLQGDAFAKTFAADAVAEHQKDIASFKQEAQSSNPQIAEFAQRTLPVLEKHLRAAEALEKASGAAAH